MQIIDPYFEIISDVAMDIQVVEEVARECYQSSHKITDDSAPGFVRGLIKSHHDAMIEHTQMTVRFYTNRGVSHELVRHRLASFCLSGDTEVVAFRKSTAAARSQKKWTLQQLWEYQQDQRIGRLKLMRLRSVDATGVIVPGRIKQVIQSGIKETYTVTTKSGRVLRSTLDHLFLTPNGWQRLGDLNVGDRLTANGLAALSNEEWLRRRYITDNRTGAELSEEIGCSWRTLYKALKRFAIVKPLSMRKNRKGGRGIPGMHGEAGRAAISERMKGDKNPGWKGGSVTASWGRSRANRDPNLVPDICWGCGESDLAKLERHHADSNPTNNNPENIIFLCQKCHKAFHIGQGVLTVFSDEIISITPYGEEMTYDLEMASDPHNFVANGLVVHNSQESTRYVNYEGKGCTFIRPIWFPYDLLGEWKRSGNMLVRPTDGAHMRIAEPLSAATAWMADMSYAEMAYNRQLQMLKDEDGKDHPEKAREVLPNSTKTSIVISANAREWRHIFSLRALGTTGRPHPEMARLMLPLLEHVKTMPYGVLFNDLGKE